MVTQLAPQQHNHEVTLQLPLPSHFSAHEDSRSSALQTLKSLADKFKVKMQGTTPGKTQPTPALQNLQGTRATSHVFKFGVKRSTSDMTSAGTSSSSLVSVSTRASPRVEAALSQNGFAEVDETPVKCKGILKPYQPSTGFGFSYNKRCNVRHIPVQAEEKQDRKVSFGTELDTTIYYYEQIDLPKSQAPWLNSTSLRVTLFGRGKSSHPNAATAEVTEIAPCKEYSEKVKVPLPRFESFQQTDSQEDLTLDDLKAVFAVGKADSTSFTPGKARSASFSPESSRRSTTPTKSNSARPFVKAKQGVSPKRFRPENVSFLAHRCML